MQNKLKILSAAILAASVFGLAGCDDIEAGLTQADADQVIINVGDATLAGNTLGELYDEIITAGSSNSEKVLNNILYKLAESYFGKFYGEGGLYETVSKGSQADIKAYAEAHAKMFDGNANKVINFFNKLKESLDKSFWGVVKNSSYQKRYKFLEKEFVQAQEKELYEFKTEGVTFVEAPVFGYKTYKNVEEYFQPNYIAFYENYIERALLPDAYRKALVEMHLIAENPNALGRSAARKVQYIALGKIDGFPEATKNLFKAYAEKVIAATDAKLTEDYPGLDIASVRDLHFLNRLYLGNFDEDPAVVQSLAASVYEAADFTHLTYEEDGLEVIDGSHYEQTTYGALLKDYHKLTTSRWEEGSSTDFTGGSTYSVETGLAIKTNELLQSNKVTEGWYTNSGLSDLPTSIKTRLFKINVATDLDNPGRTPEFGQIVNGSYYLTLDENDRDDNIPYVIYDDSSSTSYIVRVDEAVKAPKLKKGGESAYDDEKLEKIVLDIASLLADGDSYKKAARQYYVKEAAIAYHDQAIYDYFEETFPDLFD